MHLAVRRSEHSRNNQYFWRQFHFGVWRIAGTGVSGSDSSRQRDCPFQQFPLHENEIKNAMLRERLAPLSV